MPLQIRSADAAPARPDEWYGRTPASVVQDPELSTAAKAMFAAITLTMAYDGNRSMSLATMAELGRVLGVEIRQARRLVAELEARGHIVRERVRTISGSPQGIRPTAGFRGTRTQSHTTDCKRSYPTEEPVTTDRAPGHIRPGARSRPTAPLKREEKSKDPERVAGSIGERDEPARPTAAPRKETESPDQLAAALDELKALIHPRGARKSPGGSSAKIPPRGQEQASKPDAKDCNPQVAQKSRPENQREHNRD